MDDILPPCEEVTMEAVVLSEPTGRAPSLTSLKALSSLSERYSQPTITIFSSITSTLFASSFSVIILSLSLFLSICLLSAWRSAKTLQAFTTMMQHLTD